MRGRPGSPPGVHACARATQPTAFANCAASASACPIPPVVSRVGDSIPQLSYRSKPFSPSSVHSGPHYLRASTLTRPCENSGSLAIRVGIRGLCDGHAPR
eukprot:2608011-Prymnesium_polylepis.1